MKQTNKKSKVKTALLFIFQLSVKLVIFVALTNFFFKDIPGLNQLPGLIFKTDATWLLHLIASVITLLWQSIYEYKLRIKRKNNQGKTEIM